MFPKKANIFESQFKFWFTVYSDSFMASLENQKKKSPQMVDKVEDLQYTERMRKKDFYINVKKSLLNLLEFSEVRNNTIIVNN